MCGRFFIASPDGIFDYYHIPKGEREELHPDFNVSPGEKSPVILNDSKGNHLRLLRWGLIPSWAKDPKIGYKMINARMESVRDKPSWRKPFISQRALIPANGFYEWRREGTKKQPFVIKPKGRDLISFAGMYDLWKDEKGNVVPTFTIITSPADSTVSPIHDRMPVMLSPDGEKVWLNHEVRDPELLEDTLRKQTEHDLEAYPVSDRVNSGEENDASLIEKR